MRDFIQLNWTISDDDAFEICFNTSERHPLFKLALYRTEEGIDDPVEQLLEDPMSEIFVNFKNVSKIAAVFRKSS